MPINSAARPSAKISAVASSTTQPTLCRCEWLYDATGATLGRFGNLQRRNARSTAAIGGEFHLPSFTGVVRNCDRSRDVARKPYTNQPVLKCSPLFVKDHFAGIGFDFNR